MAGQESTKAIYYALGANMGIAIAKGIAAAITLSGSMLAETIHSLADCTNQVLLLFGMKRSQLPADESHPLGYGKVTYFWSFIVAMLLFSVGGLFSIYEGVHKLHATEPIKMAWLALTVLGVSVLLEMLSLMGCFKEIKKLRGDKPFSQWFKTTRSSELLVILGEDMAAVLGLIIAFVFVLLSYLLNNPLYDALGSICIGTILILVSIFLIIRMKELLIGKSADPDIEDAVEAFLAQSPKVEKLYNAITLQVGPYIMLAGKIKLVSGLDIDDACREINALERTIKEKFPEIHWIFMEPDIAD